MRTDTPSNPTSPEAVSEPPQPTPGIAVPVSCIDPRCSRRENRVELSFGATTLVPRDRDQRCQQCGARLLVRDRYYLQEPIYCKEGDLASEVWGLLDCGPSDPRDRDETFDPLPKVLKVMHHRLRDRVELLVNETDALVSLHKRFGHFNVPRLARDPEQRFFWYRSDRNRDRDSGSNPDGASGLQLPCLLMERIDCRYANLERWLQQTAPRLSQALAIEWLEALVRTLERLHACGILHRDLNPANIVLDTRGQLVLVDFGLTAWREPAATRLVGTPGFIAPEVGSGQAKRQSDYFSLGRTFAYLLTGAHPQGLFAEGTSWRARVRAPVSSGLLDLLDELMAPRWQERPSPATILQRLHDLRRPRRRLWQVAGTAAVSVAIAAGLGGMRLLGLLQPLELAAYDAFVRGQPPVPNDRIVLVTVGEKDIQYQDDRGFERVDSLADAALAQLLARLAPYEPAAVGLDLYYVNRSFPPELAAIVPETFVGTCYVGGDAGETGENIPVPPPSDLPLDRIGFSDVPLDPDNVIRRQLLLMTPPEAAGCSTDKSLSLQVARRYLEEHDLYIGGDREGNLQLGDTSISPLNRFAGGYALPPGDGGGYQTLLRYRHQFQIVSLREVLAGEADLSSLGRDRVVLIGPGADRDDVHLTPRSGGGWRHRRTEMMGVEIHAQGVAQLIDAATGERSPMWWWSEPVEGLWIAGWSLAGGLAAGAARRTRRRWRWHALGAFGLGATCTGSCLVLFAAGGWVPWVPAVLGTLLSGGAIAASRRWSARALGVPWPRTAAARLLSGLRGSRRAPASDPPLPEVRKHLTRGKTP